MLRSVLAANPSPLTLDGTRTYIVGERGLAVIDPGPALHPHLDALAEAVGRAHAVILLTHQHPDHAAGADALADRMGAPVRSLAAGTLVPGDRIATDAGELVALHTPGHTPDHLAFHWPAAAAVFCGDLLLGGMDTALVASPEGNLGQYLASLERVRALEPAVLYPTHGPPFERPGEALDAYVRHRAERKAQVLEVLETGPAGLAALTRAVYGPALDSRLEPVAAAAVVAYLEHLAEAGRVRESGGRWRLA